MLAEFEKERQLQQLYLEDKIKDFGLRSAARIQAIQYFPLYIGGCRETELEAREYVAQSYDRERDRGLSDDGEKESESNSRMCV